MKLILSRKGFDSTAGKAPAPIVTGRPISMPIPASEKSPTTYEDIGHLAAAGRGHRVNGVKDGDVVRIEAWIGAMPRGPDDSTIKARRTCRKC